VSHIILLFHIVVSGFLVYQVIYINGRVPVSRWYTATLAMAAWVLVCTAVSEYIILNMDAESDPFTEGISRFIWLVGNPALLLLVIPGLAGDVRERIIGRPRSMMVFYFQVVTGIAGLAALLFAVVFSLYPGSVQVSALFQWGYYPVVYGLLAVWAVIGTSGMAKSLTRIPVRLGAGLILLLVLIILMTLEAADAAGVFRIAGLTLVFTAAQPWGLQIPWILLVVLSVMGLDALLQHTRSQAVMTGNQLFAGTGLSHREQEIGHLVLAGKGNKEIARELDISYHTVKNHMVNIFRKLGVGSRYEFFVYLQKKTRISRPSAGLDLSSDLDNSVGKDLERENKEN